MSTPSASLASPAPPATSSATATPVRVPMPAVVCMNLQAAQDRIQAAGVFLSRSKDASGARNLMRWAGRPWEAQPQQRPAGQHSRNPAPSEAY